LLVLIDESGDPGFKISKGSTAHFVVAMVCFSDFKDAETASRVIDDARKRAGISGEFKFNNSSATVRDCFFEAVAPLNFVARALVMNKERIYSDYLRGSTDSFYNFCIRQLLSHDGGNLNKANVKIDGSGDREFKRALERYLRTQIPTGKIAKVKFVNSRNDNLIQLADMVAGAIARSYREDRANPHRWRKFIARKIENVWEFR